MSNVQVSNRSPKIIELKECTEMKKYTVHWKPGTSNWNGRTISALLPVETQYSQGTLSETTQEGDSTVTTYTLDLVDVEENIYVSGSEEYLLSISCQLEGSSRDTSYIQKYISIMNLSLSFLDKKVTKTEYFDALKERKVKVLSRGESHITTLSEEPFSPAGNTIQKTTIVGDIIVSLSANVSINPVNYPGNKEVVKPSEESNLTTLFEKIRFEEIPSIFLTNPCVE